MKIGTDAQGCNIIFDVSIWCAWEKVYQKNPKHLTAPIGWQNFISVLLIKNN